MTNATRKWTDEQIERIRFLNNAKTPWHVIAREFGVGRNAIAGVIWRYVKRRRRSEDQPKPKAVVQKSKPNRVVSIPKFKALPFKKNKYRPSSPVSMYMIKDGMCRDIIGEPREMMCCGEPTLPGHSFCPDHERIYYQRQTDTPKH